jgi:ribonucleoside-diphosphate reductase alpha chain
MEVAMSQLVSSAATSAPTEQEDLSRPPPANRHRLPDERAATTHHFSIAGHEGMNKTDISLLIQNRRM